MKTPFFKIFLNKKSLTNQVILLLSLTCTLNFISFAASAAAENLEKTENQKNQKEKLNTKATINIAIIGASFSGCSVSYFLNKAFEKHNQMYKLNITIFEKNTKLTQNFPTTKIHNRISDLNFPFIFEWQSNLKKLLKDLEITPLKYNQSNSIGIYDGEEFLVKESNKNFINKLKDSYPADMAKLLSVLHKFHKSLQTALSSVNDADNAQINNLADFVSAFKTSFTDYKGLFAERTDVFLNNLDVNFSFLDRIVRGFLFANGLKGADNNAFSSLLSVLGQLNNKYYLENGLISLVDKLVYDNPYYNVNTFLKFNSAVKKIEENKIKIKENDEDKSKTYTVTSANEITGKIEQFDYFDLVILSDKCADFAKLEIIDAEFTKDKKERNFAFAQSYKTLYNHVLLGNIKPSFFSTNNNNNNNLKESKKKSLPSTKNQDTELDLLSNMDLNNSSADNYNNYSNKENESLPDTIMINDNQGFTDFSLIQPLCKNCYLNRFYDENKQKFNSIIRVVSAHERLSAELIKKVFNGRVIYEGNKGEKFTAINRKGIMSSDSNSNNGLSNVNYLPEFEICKKRIFNNFTFSYLDDNLEFDLISSKIIANLVLKNYIQDELDILSSDF